LTRDCVEARWNRKWKYKSSLSRLDLEILIAIAMGSNTNKQLNEKLRKRKGKNVPEATISRHTTKLMKLGLITQKKIFNSRPFELTDNAKVAISIFLTEGVGEMEQVIRGHGFGFLCKILRKPKDLEDRLRSGGWAEFYPKNRVGYKKELWGCTVIFNPRSVQFIPQEVYSASQDACFDVGYRLVLRVQDFLQKEHPGLALGPVTVIYNQQYARMFDPLAVEFLKTSMKENVNLTYRSDRLAIDQSKKVPELETIHKVFSKDDLRKICKFYEDLIRTDFKIEDIGDLKEAAKLQAMAGLYLAQNLKTHVDVLNEIKTAIVELRKAGTTPSICDTFEEETKTSQKVLDDVKPESESSPEKKSLSSAFSPTAVDTGSVAQASTSQVEPENIKCVMTLDPITRGTCPLCRRRDVNMVWQVQLFDGSRIDACCMDCGGKLLEQVKKRGEVT